MAQKEKEKPKFETDPCIYTTTSTNESILIINKKEYAQRIYLEDGTKLDVNGTGKLNYTFPDIGEHKIWIEFKEDVTSFDSCFYECRKLTSIPENLFATNTAATSFTYCFGNCQGLTSIPKKLFANNTAVTGFSSCFFFCNSLTSSCPIDNDGTPIYNRSGNGKDGYAIVTSYGYCFFSCINMANFESIPGPWISPVA